MQGMGMIFSVGKWKGFTGFRWKGVKVMKRGALSHYSLYLFFICLQQSGFKGMVRDEGGGH